MDIETSKNILESYNKLMDINKKYTTMPNKGDYMITDELGNEKFDDEAYEKDYQNYINTKAMINANDPLIKQCLETIENEEEKKILEREKELNN